MEDRIEPGNAARRLDTLERLLALPASDLKSTLSHASDVVAKVMGADKVDAFLYDPTRDSLVAVGTSNQPLSARQRKLGLDVLPLTNGGRVVHVYQTGRTFLTGRLDEDAEELRGVKDGLRIRSNLGVPLVVAGTRRGVLMVASLRHDGFTDDDVRSVETLARWTGLVAHRAELFEESRRNAAEHGRRAAAEELITVVAHDLRNLIGPLDTLLHSLHRRAERDARQADVGDLQVAQRAARRLRALTADILDVARIDQGLFHGVPQPVDVAALILDTANTLSSASHAVDVRVETTGAVFVAADEARLRQCIENVIANAIQKSPKDAAVHVFVSTETRDTGEWALVEIIDDGPGVPEDVMPHIFERYRAGPHGSGGVGLGLYLAKEIALMHGGDLTADSTPGKGARFVLALPCCASD